MSNTRSYESASNLQPVMPSLLLFFGLAILTSLVVWGMIHLMLAHFGAMLIISIITNILVNILESFDQMFWSDQVRYLWSIGLIVAVSSCIACDFGWSILLGLLLTSILSICLFVATASCSDESWDVEKYISQDNSYVYSAWGCAALALLLFALHIISIAAMIGMFGISGLIIVCCGAKEINYHDCENCDQWLRTNGSQ